MFRLNVIFPGLCLILLQKYKNIIKQGVKKNNNGVKWRQSEKKKQQLCKLSVKTGNGWPL